jgi:hypothetical protein
MRPLLAALLALAVLSAGALAADPPSGKVSKDAPTVTWTGELTVPYLTYIQMFVANGEGTACDAPSCDRFTLDVTDGPADLTVKHSVTNPLDGGIKMMRIVKPDGSIVWATDDTADQPQTMKIKAAPNGQYFVDITNGSKTQASYEASATLAVAAPAAAAPPTPAAPGAPAAAATPLTLSAKAGAVSARKASKSRKVVVSVTTNRAAAVKATLLKGKKAVGSGSLTRVEGTAKLTLKVKKLKPGAHTLVLEATDGQSQARSTIKLKVRK